MKVRIGIDVGATKTKIIMISPRGEVLARDKIMTDSDKKPGPIVERAGAAVEEMARTQGIKRSQIEAVSVGICGFSNPRTGVIDVSPNLHWHKVPFVKLMRERLKMKVYMANDVNAAAWGEFRYGAGVGSSDMVAIFIGSGIGGGIVAGKTLLEGGTGTAGEVGHMTFRVGGLMCDCGQRGCFEAYGGGMPMERRIRKAAKRGLAPKAVKIAGGDIGKINTRVIRLAAEAGDKTAKRIWQEAEQSLAYLCSNLASLLNPDRIVIGGGVAEGNPGLLSLIQKSVKAHAVSLSGRHAKVVKSKLGDDAVAMGAAALVDLYEGK